MNKNQLDNILLAIVCAFLPVGLAMVGVGLVLVLIIALSILPFLFLSTAFLLIVGGSFVGYSAYRIKKEKRKWNADSNN